MARQIHGHDPEEFAESIGVSVLTLIGIENHDRQPSAIALCNICLLTGFPVKFFRQGPPPEFPMGSLLYRCGSSDAEGEGAR